MGDTILSTRAFPDRGDNRMRNVIFAINITVDGCCDHTKVVADEELLEHYAQLLRDVDLLVYGRKAG